MYFNSHDHCARYILIRNGFSILKILLNEKRHCTQSWDFSDQLPDISIFYQTEWTTECCSTKLLWLLYWWACLAVGLTKFLKVKPTQFWLNNLKTLKPVLFKGRSKRINYGIIKAIEGICGISGIVFFVIASKMC